MKIRNLCVYCGSNPGRNPVYAAAVHELARELVDRNISLVYGGAKVGLMGLLADSVLKEGGRVTGVIPEALVEKEIAHHGLTELRVTRSMHERKTIMAEISDGFMALPGGIGTLEELFEVWTWAQLGFHNKPCGLLNIAGYFNDLCAFLDHTVAEQFVKAPHRTMLYVESSAKLLLDGFNAYIPPVVTKWVSPDQT
jgi:uncharacterized protein (TIGR00730 family)